MRGPSTPSPSLSSMWMRWTGSSTSLGEDRDPHPRGDLAAGLSYRNAEFLNTEVPGVQRL